MGVKVAMGFQSEERTVEDVYVVGDGEGGRT